MLYGFQRRRGVFSSACASHITCGLDCFHSADTDYSLCFIFIKIQICTHRKRTVPSFFWPACLLICSHVFRSDFPSSCGASATLSRSLSQFHSCPSDSWPFHPPALIQDSQHGGYFCPVSGVALTMPAPGWVNHGFLQSHCCWYSSLFHFFPFIHTVHSFDLSHSTQGGFLGNVVFVVTWGFRHWIGLIWEAKHVFFFGLILWWTKSRIQRGLCYLILIIVKYFFFLKQLNLSLSLFPWCI